MYLRTPVSVIRSRWLEGNHLSCPVFECGGSEWVWRDKQTTHSLTKREGWKRVCGYSFKIVRYQYFRLTPSQNLKACPTPKSSFSSPTPKPQISLSRPVPQSHPETQSALVPAPNLNGSPQVLPLNIWVWL